MRCKPFCLFCLPADDKFRLSPLFKNRNINIGTDMGEKICAINYWNLFVQNEYKHEAMMRCHLKKNSVHIPGPTQGIRAHIPGLINHSNFRISQDISLKKRRYFTPVEYKYVVLFIHTLASSAIQNLACTWYFQFNICEILEIFMESLTFLGEIFQVCNAGIFFSILCISSRTYEGCP